MKKGGDDLREIGRLGKPHGIRGEVKVIPLSDDPDLFFGLERVFIGQDEECARAFDIASIRPVVSKRGLTILLSLKEIQNRDLIESLRGQKLFAKESELPGLDEDEFTYGDIVGFTAVSEDGEVLGTVTDVIDRPPQDLLVLSRIKKRDVMIPFVSEFIKAVDTENRKVTVSVIEGML